MYVPIILTLVTCHFLLSLVSYFFTVLYCTLSLYCTVLKLQLISGCHSHLFTFMDIVPTLGAMLIRLSLRSPSTVVGVYLHVHGTSMYGCRQAQSQAASISRLLQRSKAQPCNEQIRIKVPLLLETLV